LLNKKTNPLRPSFSNPKTIEKAGRNGFIGAYTSVRLAYSNDMMRVIIDCYFYKEGAMSYLKSVFYLRRDAVSRRTVARTALAVGLPLVLGLMRGEFIPAVYGAVAGFYCFFVDGGGPLSERLSAVVYMIFGMLMAGLAGVAGHYVPGASLALLFGVALFAGWLQGAGGAVDFIGKAALAAFLFGDYGRDLEPMSGTYLLIGGLSGLLAILLSSRWGLDREPQRAPMLHDAAQHILRRGHNNGGFAFYFCCLVVSAYLLSHALGLLRPYWVPLTVVMVTVYDPFHSMERLAQRAMGSLIGAVLGVLVIASVHDYWVLIGIIMLMAALTPIALARNYGLGVIFITSLVMILLDFGVQQAIADPWDLAQARMLNTFIGCVWCAMGSYVYLKCLPWIHRIQSH
jgi:MFS family permease